MNHRMGLWVAGALGTALACGSVSDVESGDELRRDAGVDAGRSQGDAATSGPRLEANDVSVLWPVPETGALPSGYLKLFPKSGERGPGVPSAARVLYENGFHADLPRNLVESTVAIVALRLDPCAPRASGPCKPELRLSAQPLDEQFDDAATHLIYELSSADLTQIVSDLRRLKAASPTSTSGPLRVHPGLLAAGSNTPYWRAWNDFVLKWATAPRLARLTLNSFGLDNWFFRGVARSDDWDSDKFRIPGLPTDAHAQSWIQQAPHEGLNDPTGTISPLPSSHFNALLAKGVDPRSPALKAPLALVGTFMHPSRRTPANSDCVSCHLAPQTALYYEARGANFGPSTDYAPPAGFDAAVVVDPRLKGNLSNTILFGWHRARPKAIASIAKRVVFETAEALRAMGEL